MKEKKKITFSPISCNIQNSRIRGQISAHRSFLQMDSAGSVFVSVHSTFPSNCTIKHFTESDNEGFLLP